MFNEIFTSIYETFYYSNEFSGDLYDENIYQLLGIVTVLFSVIIPVIYYIILDKVHLAKFGIWLVFILFTIIFNFLFAYIYIQNIHVSLGIEYENNEYFSIGIANAFLCGVMVLISSLAFKNASTNCKKIPF